MKTTNQKARQAQLARESLLRMKADPIRYKAFKERRNAAKRDARINGTYTEKPRNRAKSGAEDFPQGKLLPIPATAILPAVGLEFPMFRRYG